MANDNIKGDMIETSEFPHLSNKYDVQGVPHTVINEDLSIRGLVPEKQLSMAILAALGKISHEELHKMMPDEEEHKHDHEHEEK